MGSGRQRFRYFGSFSIFLAVFAILCLALPRKSEARSAMPEEWRLDKQELRAPQIEMRLLRGRVNPQENMGLHTEYIYGPKGFKSQVKPVDDEPVVIGYDRDTAKPIIDFRTVVNVPSMRCPEGYGRVHDGTCRKLIFMTRP